jgi:hypothetical protein
MMSVNGRKDGDEPRTKDGGRKESRRTESAFQFDSTEVAKQDLVGERSHNREASIIGLIEQTFKSRDGPSLITNADDLVTLGHDVGSDDSVSSVVDFVVEEGVVAEVDPC